jgi:16S rRNA C1402 (ribose-2'-O) methylase RsmI
MSVGRGLLRLWVVLWICWVLPVGATTLWTLPVPSPLMDERFDFPGYYPSAATQRRQSFGSSALKYVP